MNKIKFLLLIFLLNYIPAFLQAQFNSDLARKSIVRIYVRVLGESKQNICTGFMWKQTNQIVTSLHGMKAGANITVVYPGKELRPAKIVRLIKDPDLVMLETSNAGGSALSLKTEAVPLVSFTASAKNEMLHALGFWSDASSSQVIDIKHGDFDPEKLDGILPEKYKKQIIEMTFPSIHDPIYGLNGGSLLPGFSGSPIFNKNGDLVAIGDGGIEAGAMNVSWSIPASNLDRLSASTVAELPSTINHVPFLYSAEVSLPVESTDYYRSFIQDDIDLYQTKTRTYEEIKKTAWDTYFIDKVEALLKLMRTKINYDLLNFDVYQIPGGGSVENPGFVVTIPSGTNFYYNPDLQWIGVDLKNDSAMDNFGLFYFKAKNQGEPKKQVRQILNEKFGNECAGFKAPAKILYIDKQGKKMVRNSQFAGGWQREEITLDGNSSFTRNGEEYVLSARISIVYNADEIFCTVLTEYLSTAFKQKIDEEMFKSLLNPVDCINENRTYCNYMRALIILNCAVVLTAVNNVY